MALKNLFRKGDFCFIMKLPEKYDRKWFVILGVMFIFTLALFIIFKLIIQSDISGRNIVSFTILSALMSLVITMGGYLGYKVYFGISTVSHAVGLLYMFYIAIAQPVLGWTDLVAIMAYMFIIGTGILGGIVVQALVRLIRK